MLDKSLDSFILFHVPKGCFMYIAACVIPLILRLELAPKRLAFNAPLSVEMVALSFIKSVTKLNSQTEK